MPSRNECWKLHNRVSDGEWASKKILTDITPCWSHIARVSGPHRGVYGVCDANKEVDDDQSEIGNIAGSELGRKEHKKQPSDDARRDGECRITHCWSRAGSWRCIPSVLKGAGSICV